MEPTPELDQSIKKAIAAKRADPAYRERLERHLDENRAALDRLAEDDSFDPTPGTGTIELVFMDCQECGAAVACLLGREEPPKSCNEHT